MADSIQIFTSSQFGGIRVQLIGNEPWFVVKDVCDALGIEKHRDAASRLDDDERGSVLVDTPGGKQTATAVNESGMYALIFQSRKPEAKKFRKWVTGEVLPAIRRNGGYIVEKPDDTPDEIMARALLVAQSTLQQREQRIAQLSEENERKDAQIQMQATEIRQLKSNQSYLDLVLSCRSTVTTTAIAQDYGMSAKAYNIKLHEIGIQHKVGGQWILYQKFLPYGYVHSETINIVRSNGSPDVVMCTKWTQRGRLFLYNALKKRGILPLIERTVQK